MPHTDEKALNAFLAQALDERHPRWEVHAEQSRVLLNQAGKSPDIIIRPLGGRAGVPVVIETEYAPAATVDEDAASRLGSVLRRNGHTIEQVIALKIPRGLESVRPADLLDEIATADFEYRLLSIADRARASSDVAHSVKTEDLIRFPKDGWITGSVDDLAGFCERISMNENLLNQAVKLLESTVNSVAGGLRDALEGDRQAVLDEVAEALHQSDDPQTTRMGVAVIANALLFQTAIAGTSHPQHKYTVPNPRRDDTRTAVLDAWDQILKVNYWPIFATAYKVLEAIPDREAKQALGTLTRMASGLASYGVTSTGDMSGQMFGKLISDRKFLATFYTRPAAAHLLAELAVARLSVDWSDYEQVVSLRLADLACGTGTLLTAAYQRVMARVRRASGLDDQKIHREMMEKSLIGADIMPAAVHLTATLLSSIHPTMIFGDTRIFLMPYGRESGNGSRVEIGSLELLVEKFELSLNLFDTGREAVSGRGGRRNDRVIDHNEADLVIMNPPFTRPTNHKTAASAGVPVPSFAGFNTDDDEQRQMSKRLKKLSQKLTNIAGHGNTGLASNFLDLAHTKTKPGGIVAFVLPFTVVIGKDWSAARQLFAKHYRDICVVSIAATGSTDRAFSADTGMAEVLIIATRRYSTENTPTPRDGHPSECEEQHKKINRVNHPGSEGQNTPREQTKDKNKEPAPDQVLYANLYRCPKDLVEGVEIARRISNIGRTLASESSQPTIRTSGSLDVGATQVGNFIRGSIHAGGCAGAREPDLADCAVALTNGRVRLPRLNNLKKIRLTRLSKLGYCGPYHLDINSSYTSKRDSSEPRGPFDIIEYKSYKTWRQADYPALWAHDAKRETRLIVEPDREGRVRPGCEKRAEDIWDTASRLHFNLDFRLNSQPLAACLTPEPSIGGTAWPSFILSDERWEKAVLLWANTTLGLIGFWWIGSRQQQGRARLTITRLPELSVLDPRTLTDKQLNKIEDIFKLFASEEFLPANEAYRDDTRETLDNIILVELLGCDEASVIPSLAVLRDQWCREPSVHGGKKTRPRCLK